MKAKIKGRVMWADIKQGRFEGKPICRINEFNGTFSDMTTPVLVLPLDDLEGLVEQVAASFCLVRYSNVELHEMAPQVADETRWLTKQFLSSLGVRFPKQRKSRP